MTFPWRFYAATPARRTAQIVGDVAAVVWIWLWVVLAGKVRDATLGLATPGRKIDASASDLAERLRDAGRAVAKVPLVGDDVRGPFEGFLARTATWTCSHCGRWPTSRCTSWRSWTTTRRVPGAAVTAT